MFAAGTQGQPQNFDRRNSYCQSQCLLICILMLIFAYNALGFGFLSYQSVCVSCMYLYLISKHMHRRLLFTHAFINFYHLSHFFIILSSRISHIFYYYKNFRTQAITIPTYMYNVYVFFQRTGIFDSRFSKLWFFDFLYYLVICKLS